MFRSALVCASLVVTSAASAQTVSLVEQRTLNGTVIMTGNTLGLSGYIDDLFSGSQQPGTSLQDRPGKYHSAYAWLADRPPGGRDNANWPLFTTGDWTNNFSWADLDLSPVGGGRVVKLYLLWSGSCIGDDTITVEDVSADIDGDVIFEYPTGSGSTAVFVSPDQVIDHCGDDPDGYVAWADVTDLAESWEEGLYGVGGVPGTQNLTRVGYAGWTLAAIVENPATFPEPHQASIWAGWVPTDLGAPPAPTVVDGFCYPSPAVGDPNPGRLLVTSAEGDAVIFGDFLYFGRSTSFTPTNLMWGPRNPLFNFFGSQLVDRDGDIILGGDNVVPPDHRPWLSDQCAAIDDDTTDFGEGPHPDGIDADCLVDGARQGWDITDIPINDSTWNPNILQTGDTRAYIQPGTEGDAYRILALAMDLPSVSASVTTVTSATWDRVVTVNPGAGETDTATFTLPLTNVGSTTANDLSFTHAFPSNVSRLVSFSYRLGSGAPVNPGVTLSSLAAGISLPDLPVNQTITLTYTIEVDDYEPADPIQTRAEWNYSWTSCSDVNTATVPSVPMDIDVDYCIDADRDGVCASDEDIWGTDDDDRDSDDDGIEDRDEIENTQTDPASVDSDGDGIQDGTELGVTLADVGPDTDTSVFIPDAHPASVTDPNDPDTDNGTTRDGVEDANRNGRVDAGECDPNNPADDLTCTDADNDGLSDDVEDDLGTDPNDDDTDNDGLIDGWEVAHNTDPDNADTDGDGLLDGLEVGLVSPQGEDTDMSVFEADADPTTRTDPRQEDSDLDGLDDGDEDANHDGAQDRNETDPDDDDSDDDGILDGNEAQHGADPLDPDTDDDGILDGVEVGLTEPEGNDTDPSVFRADADPTTTTDPNDADTDDGSVPDGEEDADQDGEIDPFERDPNDPTDDLAGGPDCDNDGLSDLVEEEAGTLPCDPDSDGDGVNDLEDEIVDSDGDGLIDALDPDSDNDGIPDGAEDRNGNGQVDPGETDPDSPDLFSGGACSSVPAAPMGLGLLAVALVALRRRRAAIAAAAALAVAAPALAQVAPLIDVQRFDPEAQPDGFSRILEGNLRDPGTWAFGLAANYALRPLELRNVDGQRTAGVIDHLVGGDVTASVVVARGIQLGVQMPVIEWQAGPAADEGLGEALGGSGGSLGIGDLAATGSIALLNQDAHGIGIVLAPRAVFPTGSNAQLVGIGTYGVGGKLAVGRSWDSGVRFGFNFAYQVNLTSMTLGNLHPDDEMGVGLGLGIPIGNGWAFDVELTGATSVSPFLWEETGKRAFDGPHTPMELSIALRPASNGLVRANIGGGPGLNTGFGTPIVRGFGLVRITNARDDVDTDGDGLLDAEDRCVEEPEDRDGWQDEDGCPDPDNDQDGVVDTRDRCMMVPEDPDGFEDQDGCPDDDNDADGIFDSQDACPLIAEVYNGVDDTDGCPEGDQDGDGLYDVVDSCPTEAEDFDGFEDIDGCPDPDNDGDGFLDAADGCSGDAEDFDGWQDEDGCPDPDNDGDGIPDGDDACPLEAEVFNQHQDDDGCPDQLLARIEGTRIVILEKVYFDTGRATIREVSFPVLDAVFDILDTNPRITMLEVQGHTDSDGSESMNLDLSQRRAEAVRDYLIAKGIDGSRLVARGFGESSPIEPNTTAAGKAANRRVEFHIVGDDD